MFHEDGYDVFMEVIDLHEINPDEHKKGEYGIGICKVDLKTKEIIESEVYIHNKNKSKEACQRKIDSLRMEFQEDMPAV